MVHSSRSGLIKGRILGALRSSSSKTARSFLGRPKRVEFSIRLEATPVATLEPDRLQVNSYPHSVRISSTMLETVVLPLVPVMPMMVLGRGIRPRKSGQRMMAQLPGMEVAFFPSNFMTRAVPLAKKRAKKNRGLLFINLTFFAFPVSGTLQRARINRSLRKEYNLCNLKYILYHNLPIFSTLSLDPGPCLLYD